MVITRDGDTQSKKKSVSSIKKAPERHGGAGKRAPCPCFPSPPSVAHEAALPFWDGSHGHPTPHPFTTLAINGHYAPQMHYKCTASEIASWVKHGKAGQHSIPAWYAHAVTTRHIRTGYRQLHG